VKEEKDNSQPKKTKTWQKALKVFLWSAAIFLVLASFFTFYTINKGDLPTFEELENPEYDLASIIYDAQNRSFGKYYIENREPVTYEQLSPKVIEALVATEDERFFEHSGIDLKALGRVAFKTVLLSKESSGGGSTISQQLAKLLFERPNLKGKNKIQRMLSLVEVKFKEWITAVKLERQYTKEEIMAMYLNKFEFINGAHGIQAASETYFDKRQIDLDIHEAATLVGMLKNPSLYNPKRFPEKAKSRRNVVLGQMKKAGVIDQTALDSFKLKDINMEGFTRKTQSEGPAPYFRAELTKFLRKIFKDNDILKADGSPYNIYTDGLKIYTKALVSIDTGKSSWKKETDENRLRQSRLGEYKKLISDPLWDKLQMKWKDLVQAYDKEFNEERELLVFDYEKGEILKSMSPRDSVKYHNQHLQAGMLAVDPHTGYIKAWVGGIDHRYFKYDWEGFLHVSHLMIYNIP